MKVTHISTSCQGGGAGIAAFRLHENLMKVSNIDSTLIQRFHVEQEYARKNNIETALTSRNIITRIRKKYNYHTEHFNWLELQKHERNYGIATFPTTSYRLDKEFSVLLSDIVHLHWVNEFLDYPSFFPHVKQPLVWTLHDINPFNGLFHFETDRLNNIDTFGELDKKQVRIKRQALAKKNNITIVCLSEWMKRQSEASEVLGQFPHIIIPNGLDFNLYPFLDKDICKKKLGLNNKKKNILIVGAELNHINKGFPLFLEAISNLERDDYNIISIGKLEDLENKVEALKNHIHLDFTSDIAELNEYYTSADIVVIPSFEDNLPNVMLEAFANGTPIMSFSNGGMAEHINNHQNGVLIPEISSEVLLEYVENFLDNKYTFDRNIIREYAISTFSAELQTQKYINLYNQILKK